MNFTAISENLLQIGKVLSVSQKQEIVLLIIINLVVLLIGAKLLGEICERFDIPSVLGYILTGIIAGPMLFGQIVPDLFKPEYIESFAKLGIILMLFITGFQQNNIEELLKNKKAIILTSTLGYFIPFIVSILIAYFFYTQLGLSIGSFPLLSFLLLLALMVASTDSGITLKSIMSVGKLNTRPGKIMLGVTVMDSITGLVIFTAIMTYVTLGHISIFHLLKVVFLIAVFLLLFLIMQRITPALVRVVEHLSVEQAEFSFAFIFMLLLAITAEKFGLHGIIGAFLAGVILSKCQIATSGFLRKISSISYGIFIPIFFVWTGLMLNLGNLKTELQVLLALAIAGGVIVANSVAAYVSGKLSNLSKEECLLMSITMLPRGDINLVIASIAVKMTVDGHLFLPPELGNFLYSSVMVLVLLAAFVTFILLKIFTSVGIIKKGG